MEKFLRKCLDSLIISDENRPFLEVLVINDGSKDSSSMIAHEYESKYPQTFRVIDKENGNYGSCINRGLKEAKGKYIKILDADDWFDTKTFECFISKLFLLDVDLVITDFNIKNSEGKCFRCCRYNLPKETVFDMSEMVVDRLMWMHSVTYKTENLRQIRYKQTEGISYTDQEWIFIPFATIKSVYYLPLSLYQYLVGRDGQTISEEAVVKNISQEVHGLFVMAKEYEEVLPWCENKNLEYLSFQLKKRINHIYMSYLCRYNHILQKKEILDIDNNLKDYPNVYKLTEEVVFTRKIAIKYIKLWHHNFSGCSFLFKCLKPLEKIVYRLSLLLSH